MKKTIELTRYDLVDYKGEKFYHRIVMATVVANIEERSYDIVSNYLSDIIQYLEIGRTYNLEENNTAYHTIIRTGVGDVVIR